MKNKLILTIFIVPALIGGCSYHKSGSLSNECIDCQRLRDVLKYFKEEEHAEKVILAEFKTEYGYEAGGEVPWEEFEKIVIQSAGCCTSKPHPLAKEWMECNRLECILEHLEGEKVRKIAFCDGSDFDLPPEDWHPWAEITEPERIKKVMKLLCKAIKKEKNKFANENTVISIVDRMQIITDEHKFIIPISCYKGAVRGIGWTSYELREKLRRWGFSEPK